MEILICLEGSPSTARAVEVAIDLARWLPAGLVGLAIVDEPDIVAGSATSIGGASYRHDRDAALLDDAHRRARVWLADFVARGRAAGVDVRTLEITGRPAEMILAEMSRRDLTLLGRDANFRFETQDHDRYTRDRVLRRAGKPVVVVPEQCTTTTSGAAVMIAYDGSPAAGRALRSFADLRLARSREIHVVTVDDDGAHAYETATRGCALLADLGIRAIPDNVVSSEPVGTALVTRCTRLGAQMIVLGGYIPSPLARWMWGSVTHDVIERASVPIFLHY
jgi:nucleotide-binding universal stress UspA family protein